MAFHHMKYPKIHYEHKAEFISAAAPMLGVGYSHISLFLLVERQNEGLCNSL
jgi:hypothetical protein